MSSMSEGIAAVERIAEQLEDAGVEVQELRDCGTSVDGKRVQATIEVEARVDVLTEIDETDSVEQDTTTDDTDASDDTNHDIECEQLTPAKKDVVDALAEHGELSSSDVETVTGRSYKHLSDLEERDIVESRKDPDDGRRYLYSLSAAGRSLAEKPEHGEGNHDESGDTDDQEDLDEDQTADVGAEIDTAATNWGDLTVTDIDWLDESSFHVAVAESSGLQELRATLGWRDEDGDLAALVQGMDATDDLPDFQEGNA